MGLLGGVIGVTAALLFGGIAGAQDYPTKPIRIIVPASAGGGADVLARLLGGHMGPALGTSFVVENRAGAGGIIGTDAVAKAPPDGYTLLLWANTLVITPSLFKVPYDINRDFAPVGLVAATPNLLVVNSELNVRNLAELLALAKRTPGGLTYGTPALGSASHLAIELLAASTSVQLVHVPFKGAAQALAETLGGRVPLTIGSVAAFVPHLKSGKVVALAATGLKRSALAPDVPTFIELGIKAIDMDIWFAMVAPAGTPTFAVQKLSQQMNVSLKSPEVVERLEGFGFSPLGGTPEDLRATMRREEPLYARIIKEARITAQ